MAVAADGSRTVAAECYVTTEHLPDLGWCCRSILVAQVDDVDDEANQQLNNGANDVE